MVLELQLEVSGNRIRGFAGDVLIKGDVTREVVTVLEGGVRAR